MDGSSKISGLIVPTLRESIERGLPLSEATSERQQQAP